MKIAFLFLTSFTLLISCGDPANLSDEHQEITEGIDSDSISKEVNDTEITTESAQLPKRILNQPEMILCQVDGDLDKDGVAEKVVVFSRDLEWESSAPRDLIIYKQVDGVWEEWVVTENAILRADEGGMMGDPFHGDISINKGVLEISHSGGSSWKWGYTDKYRYQDGAFNLIGYTSTYGKPCEYWQDTDYNLSTGNCVFTFEPEVCEDYESGEDYGPRLEEKFKHKMEKLPLLNNRRTFEYEFESPNGEIIYL